MQIWRVSLRRGTLLPTLALVGSLGACNPLAGLENMEGCGLDARDTALQPGDDEKLAPTLATLTSMHVGSVSWTMTGNRSTVVVTSALDQQSATTPTRDVDCDLHFQGYYVYLVAQLTTSDLSFVDPNLYFTVHLDSEARVISGDVRFQVPLSFERLKVLGVAPDTIPDDTQWFTLAFAAPDMKPRDTEIVVRDSASRSVSLGTLSFP
ncbi:MAG: hypothetical protein ABUL62_28200 [Myxococcales bacterium]